MGCATSHDATAVSSPRARYALRRAREPSVSSIAADSHDSTESTFSDDGHLAREPSAKDTAALLAHVTMAARLLHGITADPNQFTPEAELDSDVLASRQRVERWFAEADTDAPWTLSASLGSWRSTADTDASSVALPGIVPDIDSDGTAASVEPALHSALQHPLAGSSNASYGSLLWLSDRVEAAA
uniref:Uncharacterized protein n=1 Tax=Neobodo designis TaxID=312471 RepID=A0A7S1R2M0_NEODS|mmetsp:Transcript_7142/g.22358  ORF Transcript_7142/g.22358 Transcript_7142/m.22358 type:complete len:186 (+) Transcript_7142:91-648(+)